MDFIVGIIPLMVGLTWAYFMIRQQIKHTLAVGTKIGMFWGGCFTLFVCPISAALSDSCLPQSVAACDTSWSEYFVVAWFILSGAFIVSMLSSNYWDLRWVTILGTIFTLSSIIIMSSLLISSLNALAVFVEFLPLIIFFGSGLFFVIEVLIEIFDYLFPSPKQKRKRKPKSRSLPTKPVGDDDDFITI